MFIYLLLLSLGIVLLIIGADRLVVGASSVAKRMHVSDLAIGLTIVAFGTSAPELVVNTFAAWKGNADIVFGNVIGSNNFNLFIILGLTGLIFPLKVQTSTIFREIPFSFFAIILLFFLVNDQLFGLEVARLSRIDGIILLLLFGLFLWYVFNFIGSDTGESPTVSDKPLWRLWGMVLIGLVGLFLGGKLVVDNAVLIAEQMGVSEKVIGLTIVAAGTSLPELVTSVVAALKKNNDIAVGNIIGSNIFNVFLILGSSALVRPIQYNSSFNLELLILSIGTIFLFSTMFISRRKVLDRWEAAILFFSYMGYTIWLLQ